MCLVNERSIDINKPVLQSITTVNCVLDFSLMQGGGRRHACWEIVWEEHRKPTKLNILPNKPAIFSDRVNLHQLRPHVRKAAIERKFDGCSVMIQTVVNDRRHWFVSSQSGNAEYVRVESKTRKKTAFSFPLHFNRTMFSTQPYPRILQFSRARKWWRTFIDTDIDLVSFGVQQKQLNERSGIAARWSYYSDRSTEQAASVIVGYKKTFGINHLLNEREMKTITMHYPLLLFVWIGCLLRYWDRLVRCQPNIVHYISIYYSYLPAYDILLNCYRTHTHTHIYIYIYHSYKYSIDTEWR